MSNDDIKVRVFRGAGNSTISIRTATSSLDTLAFGTDYPASLRKSAAAERERAERMLRRAELLELAAVVLERGEATAGGAQAEPPTPTSYGINGRRHGD